MKMKINKNMQQSILFLMALGVSIFMLFFVITCTWIGYSIKDNCRLAKGKYEGNCTKALISTLEDESNDFRERNNAIWALGQLGEESAAPVLEKLYTGNIPDREPLDQVISQYELKKALKLTKGGFNISALVWKFFVHE
ncbi:HEAT repeat domain-containing protein [Patescibacteria group bacterium]|nr:HEAT repeat domain-containing protein [Patescibacteria group bacterium]